MAKKSGRRSGSVVTIHDVARHAGVSPMTVSRVINAESNVREETRARVAAARKLLTLVYYGLRDGEIRCLLREAA